MLLMLLITRGKNIILPLFDCCCLAIVSLEMVCVLTVALFPDMDSYS